MEFAENMKKIILLAVLVLLPVLACSQAVASSPVTIEWDGGSSMHEIAIQKGLEDIIIIGETPDHEYLVNLQQLNIYGVYTVLVRGVEEESGYFNYSDWIRSDNEEDVILIDGVAQVFQIVSIKTAIKPDMLRIK